MLKTTHGLLRELETRSPRIAAMQLTGKVTDVPLEGKSINLANMPKDLDRAARAVELLIGNSQLAPPSAETMVRQLVSARHFYGAYSEPSAYEWLGCHGIEFTAQV